MALVSQWSPDAGVRQLRHDLLNPINVLTGIIDALLQSDLDPRQRDRDRSSVASDLSP